jgi:hypothetical protein
LYGCVRDRTSAQRSLRAASRGRCSQALLSDRGPIQIFLPLPEFTAPQVVGVGEEQFAKDLWVPHSEGGGEVGAGEWLVDLGREQGPRSKVLFGGVDQGAVDVPDDCG